MNLGEKIRKLRLNKDITQKEIAEELNVSFQTISKWENNINEPDLASLKKLSNILSCPIEFFFEDNENKVNDFLDKMSHENDLNKLTKEKEESDSISIINSKNNEDLKKEDNSNKTINEDSKYNKKEIEKNYSTYPYGKEHFSFIKGSEIGALEKVGQCNKCNKHIFNNMDYYEGITLLKNDTTISKIYCSHCYKNRNKIIIGICNDCKSPIFEGETLINVKRENDTGSVEKIPLCSNCYKKVQNEKGIVKLPRAKSKQVNSNLKNNNSSSSHRADFNIIVSSIVFAMIAFILTLILCIIKFDVVGIGWTIGLPIIFGYMILSTIYCLFSDTYISMVFIGIGSRTIKFPGLIFQFSFDGLKWLIGMKILFAIISFLFFIGITLLATFVSIFLSFFSYIPLLIHNKAHYIE